MSRNDRPLYFPPRGGRYQVAPGLSRFGKWREASWDAG